VLEGLARADNLWLSNICGSNLRYCGCGTALPLALVERGAHGYVFIRTLVIICGVFRYLVLLTASILIGVGEIMHQ